MLLFIPAPHHSHSFLSSSLNALVLLFFLMQTDCSCLTCLFFSPLDMSQFVNWLWFQFWALFVKFSFKQALHNWIQLCVCSTLRLSHYSCLPRLYAVLHCFGQQSHLALDRLIPFWICSSRPWLICSFPGWALLSSEATFVNKRVVITSKPDKHYAIMRTKKSSHNKLSASKSGSSDGALLVASLQTDDNSCFIGGQGRKNHLPLSSSCHIPSVILFNWRGNRSNKA